MKSNLRFSEYMGRILRLFQFLSMPVFFSYCQSIFLIASFGGGDIISPGVNSKMQLRKIGDYGLDERLVYGTDMKATAFKIDAQNISYILGDLNNSFLENLADNRKFATILTSSENQEFFLMEICPSRKIREEELKFQFIANNVNSHFTVAIVYPYIKVRKRRTLPTELYPQTPQDAYISYNYLPKPVYCYRLISCFDKLAKIEKYYFRVITKRGKFWDFETNVD